MRRNPPRRAGSQIMHGTSGDSFPTKNICSSCHKGLEARKARCAEIGKTGGWGDSLCQGKLRQAVMA